MFKGGKSTTSNMDQIKKSIEEDAKDKLQELFCYVYFNQKKDPLNPRGYSQWSVVLISRIKMIKIFNVTNCTMPIKCIISGLSMLIKRYYAKK